MTAYAAYDAFYRRSIEDRDGFWAEQAQRIDWQTPPQQICDFSNPPFALCFVEHRPGDDANVFVLVDESHRSQTGRYGGHSQFATKMRRLLPKACYLGFTGTPLLKKEKNTLSTFGGLIHKYAIDEAVADGAVVPLLYEGRFVEQQVNGGVIDKWFDKISEGLTNSQKADLKRKFSRMDALSKTGQAIRAKAFDISEHFRQHWQGTGFKAQLVAPSKAAAVRFKEVLDEIGHVTSEIVISPPDDNEGNEEVDKESKDLGPVAVWCRSFHSILCIKGDELWDKHGRTNFARMQCA